VIDRRQFLAQAGGVAATGIVGRRRRWSAPRAARDPRLEALARQLQGSVVGRADPAYSAARLLFDTRFDSVLPLAIVYCETASDVEKTVAWARRERIPMRPRSGGHSYGGYSAGSGVVADVTRMSGVAVDAVGKTAAIGAGARLADVYAGLWQRRVAIPAGSCPTVGVAGLSLGGGFGLSSRKLGMSADNLLQAELVTAAGKRIVCNANEHADLYWALRGGGGGNFGIVTAFRFSVHPVDKVAFFTVSWPWQQASMVVSAWQGWAPHVQDELSSVCNLTAVEDKAPGTLPRVNASGQFFGSEQALKALLQPLLSAGTPTKVTIGTRTFIDAVHAWAGCKDATQCHLAGQSPGGKVGRRAFKGKSDYVNAPLPQAGIDAMIRWIGARQQDPVLGRGAILLDAYGGAINRVPKAATAFVHRDALFSCQYLAYWQPTDPPTTRTANLRWINAFYAAMRPFVSGFAYQNYIDPDLPNWARAYYGSNLPRLVHVKKTYDPGNLFRFQQSIPTHL
jgi:FAD/FMN-containing dehydrogenase